MLGVVDWNMKFLYVLPGWEGSASDSRVLRDSMRTNRQDAFAVPHERYYLADAGYTNGPRFLAPFRSTWFHLKEWASSQLQPQMAKELYNLRHSRARNVVERTFGLWKKKWSILRTQSFFDIKDQVHVSIGFSIRCLTE
uniref:DDE Tnp4 domain-containing protein n=1 Tax=Aegilops tauschii subsp. strangulata TaxID=200361 RepID=A0A453H8A8_AEGTS